MAQRYGRLPSDLKSISIEDLQFNLLVGRVGVEADEKRHKEALKKAQIAKERGR